MPAVIGIAPYMGLNFAFFDYCKFLFTHFQVTSRHGNRSKVIEEALVNSASGAVAGALSKLIVYPLVSTLSVRSIRNTYLIITN